MVVRYGKTLKSRTDKQHLNQTKEIEENRLPIARFELPGGTEYHATPRPVNYGGNIVQVRNLTSALLYIDGLK